LQRFDDRWSWRLLEKVVVPLCVAVLTAAVIWGSMKEKITNLEKINASERLMRLETQYTDMASNVSDIRIDVKELLKRTRRD